MNIQSKPRIAFVVNGRVDSPMGQRASEIALRILDRFDIQVFLRNGFRGMAVVNFLKSLRGFRPELSCVFDLALDGVIAASIHQRLNRIPWVLDTGDDIVALGQALGRGRFAMMTTRWLERIGYRQASHVVVRGRGHLELLANRVRNATWIPDGVQLKQFLPMEADLPTEPSSSNPLTIGVIGSCVWSEAKQMCYGSELVEAIHLLRSRYGLAVPVRGEMIGDGSGINVLKKRLEVLGLGQAIKFHGHQPYSELPALIRKWHICLSTQTDDAVGRVRTTGKLPLYLASGRFVLASRVGEAARILPDEMLIDYAGEQDLDYPNKVACRITELVKQEAKFRFRSESVDIANTYFDYDKLAEKYSHVLQQQLGLLK